MARYEKLRQNGTSLLSPLLPELRLWNTTGPRIYFAIRVIAALSLAVLSSRLLGLDYPGWAALSSFAVMSLSLKESLMRGIYRIMGTILGGMLALLLSPLLADRAGLIIAFCALAGAFTVWHASVSSRAYAWVLGTVTAIMVMAEAQKLSASALLFKFTFSRIEEVIVGCMSCVLVTFLLHPLYQRLAKPVKEATPIIAIHPVAPANRLMLACQAGLTLALVTTLLLTFHLTGLWQAIISVLAILILPSSTQPLQQQITSRMFQRFMGCLTATLLSLFLLQFLYSSALLYILTLWAGLWVGCHLQQGNISISYFGRQFTVAWIIVFVQDTLWLTDPKLAAMRSLSILIATGMLACVMALSALSLRKLRGL